MKRAYTTTRAFIFFTVLFVLIAVFSFAAFRQTGEVCTAVGKKCSQPSPSRNGSEMIWDGFSKRFISMVSLK